MLASPVAHRPYVSPHFSFLSHEGINTYRLPSCIRACIQPACTGTEIVCALVFTCFVLALHLSCTWHLLRRYASGDANVHTPYGASTRWTLQTLGRRKEGPGTGQRVGRERESWWLIFVGSGSPGLPTKRTRCKGAQLNRRADGLGANRLLKIPSFCRSCVFPVVFPSFSSIIKLGGPPEAFLFQVRCSMFTRPRTYAS